MWLRSTYNTRSCLRFEKPQRLIWLRELQEQGKKKKTIKISIVSQNSPFLQYRYKLHTWDEMIPIPLSPGFLAPSVFEKLIIWTPSRLIGLPKSWFWRGTFMHARSRNCPGLILVSGSYKILFFRACCSCCMAERCSCCPLSQLVARRGWLECCSQCAVSSRASEEQRAVRPEESKRSKNGNEFTLLKEVEKMLSPCIFGLYQNKRCSWLWFLFGCFFKTISEDGNGQQLASKWGWMSFLRSRGIRKKTTDTQTPVFHPGNPTQQSSSLPVFSAHIRASCLSKLDNTFTVLLHFSSVHTYFSA